MTLVPFLHNIPDLAEVPTDDITWLAEHSQVQAFEKGDLLFETDKPADHLLIVLKGHFTIFVDRQGHRQEVSDLSPGSISGVLPYSRMVKATGIGQAKGSAEVLRLHRQHFPEMIAEHFSLTQALVHVMTNRVRMFSVLQSQNEKLLSLGKLSAGLAHELNNPASAIVRSAHSLQQHLQHQPDNFKQVMRLTLSAGQIDAIGALLSAKLAGHQASCSSLMAKTEAEDELQDWLDDHDIADADDLIEQFVDYDITPEDLASLAQEHSSEQLSTILHWLASQVNTERMVNEIKDASGRIAELISSIKSYTHMDQSKDRQPVDVHAALRNTCIMLKHKFKRYNVQLVEDFAPDLPQVRALPGELNQVWTNLVDNALDALEETANATLTLATSYDEHFVRVNVIDNGPGVPEPVQNQIFDPFYTTKTLGKGTGLGLDVALKIVQQHRGEIKLKSEPGKTVFGVCLVR